MLLYNTYLYMYIILVYFAQITKNNSKFISSENELLQQ